MPEPEPASPVEEEEEDEEEDEEEVEVEEEEEEEEVEEAEEEEEVEEDEQEEEVEVEEEVEELEEEEEEEEGQGGADEEEEAGDSSNPKVKSQLPSEGQGQDPKSVSLTPKRLESNHVTSTQDKVDICGNLLDHTSSAKIILENKEDASDTTVVDVLSMGQDKHASSEVNGCSSSPADEREILDNRFREDPKCAKNSCTEVQNHQFLLNSCDTIGSGDTPLLKVESNDAAENIWVKSGSVREKSDGVLETEETHLLLKTELKKPEDSSLSSIQTPQRRPRSSSPGATVENQSKKPAIICAYFARGWCIKGNSCRFLHQKEGNKKDLAESSGAADGLDATGSGAEADRSRVSSQERADFSNAESLLKSQLQIQRDLVRAYGGEGDGSPDRYGGYKRRAAEEFHEVDTTQGGRVIGEEYKRSPSGITNQFNSMDDGQQLTNEGSLSGRSLNEGKLQQEVPEKGSINGSHFSRGSLTMNSSVPEHRYYSGRSSTPSSLFPNSNNPFAHDIRTEDFPESRFALLDKTHNSSNITSGSFNSGLKSSSLRHGPGSPLTNTFGEAGASSAYYGSTPFSLENYDIRRPVDLDKGYQSSRSASLWKSSSPNFSSPDVRNVRHKTECQGNSWEPSVPFRPSFHFTQAILSSPGSQYDPLLDSIEPLTTGKSALQSSERIVSQNLTTESTNGDPLFYGSQVAGCNRMQKKALTSSPQAHELILDGNLSSHHALSRQTGQVADPGHSAVDEEVGSVPKDKSIGVSNPVSEGADVNVAEVGGVKYQGEKSKITKESKAMKFFRTALVEFVKELVKPSWREGHLSKDAHKMVVKKAVEKVLGAVHPHQIPNTTESINQYLASSRPKLLKLVEGYVEKYSKSVA